MKALKTFRAVALLLLALLATGCSPTVLAGSWRDPQYAGGPIRKVLVVGVSEQDLVRRLFEDEFARQLREEGVTAAASYGFFSVEQVRERREAVEAKVRGLGYDKIIVTRLVGKRDVEVVQPGTVYGSTGYGGRYYGGWHDYYRDSWSIVYEPPVVYQVTVATIESKLFDLGTGQPIWSGLLETEVGGTAMSSNMEYLIEDFVRTVIRDFAKEGLL
jgi:hypothetical protein